MQYYTVVEPKLCVKSCPVVACRIHGQSEECYYLFIIIIIIIIIIINAAVVKKFSNWLELFKFTINVLPIRKVLLRVVTVDVEAAAVVVLGE
jgi:hypothetical protein